MVQFHYNKESQKNGHKVLFFRNCVLTEGIMFENAGIKKRKYTI